MLPIEVALLPGLFKYKSLLFPTHQNLLLLFLWSAGTWLINRLVFFLLYWASLVAQMVENLSAMQEIWVRSLSGRSPEVGNCNPLQYFCRRIPWTEKPGGLQSMGSQRVRLDWATFTFLSSVFEISAYHRIWLVVALTVCGLDESRYAWMLLFSGQGLSDSATPWTVAHEAPFYVAALE